MTYQPLGLCIPPRFCGAAASAISISNANLMDADGEGTGGVFVSPVTDTLTKVGLFFTTVTTGDTLDIRVETVGADGLPTGTLVGVNTSATLVVGAADDNTFFEVTLTAGASLTRGDLFAVVVTRPTAGTFNGRIAAAPSNIITSGLPYFIVKTAAWAQSTGTGPNFSLYFSSAGYAQFDGAIAVSSQTFSTAMNNTTTPDVQGNVINFPWVVKVSGVWLNGDFDGDYDIKLYDSDGTTVLGTISMDADYPPSTGVFTISPRFSSDITLSADTDYRLVVEATSASNVALSKLIFPTAAIMQQCPWATFAQRTTAKDPAALVDWTDTATELTLIGFDVKEIDIPAAGGTTGIARLTGGGLVK